MQSRPAVGIILSGGAARGAYQAGILRGLGKISDDLGLEQPFQVLSGVSAGAINSAYLAGHPGNFFFAADELAKLWSNLCTEQVFRTDFCSLGSIGFKWTRDILSSGAFSDSHPGALLDTAPLRDLINQNIDFTRLQKNVANGRYKAVSISCTEVSSANNVTFFSGKKTTTPWNKYRRIGIPENIAAEHVLASSSIPLFFPPVRVGRRFYADGCLRNMAPLSPAIHLGCDKLLIVGVRRRPDSPEPENTGELEETFEHKPSVGKILSTLINAVMLDNVEADVERLQRINQTLSYIDDDSRKDIPLRKIDYLLLQPSLDLAELAMRYTMLMPRNLRFLLGGLGTEKDSSDLTSYLLFERDYCSSLVELGYADTLNQRDEIQTFLLDGQESRSSSLQRNSNVS